jgi:uncharacterized glyoxalase superfamily metalloenzyme YdcJ
LEATQPELIVSANMACQQHLQAGTAIPVQHWIELLDQALAASPQSASLSLSEQTHSATNSNEFEVISETQQAPLIEAVVEAMAVAATESIVPASKKKSTRKSDKPTSNKKAVTKSKSDVLEVDNTAENTDKKKAQKPAKKSSKKKT